MIVLYNVDIPANMIIQLREARLKANEATEAKLLHIKENPIPNKEC